MRALIARIIIANWNKARDSITEDRLDRFMNWFDTSTKTLTIITVVFAVVYFIVAPALWKIYFG